MGLLEPYVGYGRRNGQTALIDDEEPSPQAQRIALWVFGVITALVAVYLALAPGAWDGMVEGLKFMTGYVDVGELLNDIEGTTE